MSESCSDYPAAGRRRILQFGAAAVGAALSRPAKAASKELRLINVESEPQTVTFLKSVAQEYEAATGVSLSVETIVGTQLWTKVTAAIKAGRPYDLITFAQQTQTVLLAEQGQLVPVTDIVKEIGIDDFGPRALVTYKQDIWGLPYNYNFSYLFYRKDWLDEVKLGVPTNWAEFTQVAKAFTNPVKKRFGTTLPYSQGTTPWGNTGFLWAAGVQFYDNDWNVLIDTPAIKPKLTRALEFLVTNNPCNAPGQYSMTLGNIITNFTSGTAGIAAYMGRLIQAIESNAPDLADKFAISPYPAPDGGKGSVTYGGKEFAIGKTANSKEAIDFLRWFMKTGKITDFQLTLPMYMQPTQYSTYQNPRWLANPTIKKYWPAMQTMREFMDKDAVNVNAIEFQGSPLTVNQGLLLNSEVILTMYQNVLSKKMTVSEAVDDCAASMRKFTRKDA